MIPNNSQFTEDVSRGFRTDTVKQPLGLHWSKDEYVAHHFADNLSPQTTVMYAKANPNDVVKPGSSEHKKLQEDNAIYSNKDLEQESTIRPGSKVLITGIHKTNDKGKTRLRTYKKGKEMTT